jgi:hypothetical protein
MKIRRVKQYTNTRVTKTQHKTNGNIKSTSILTQSLDARNCPLLKRSLRRPHSSTRPFYTAFRAHRLTDRPTDLVAVWATLFIVWRPGAGREGVCTSCLTEPTREGKDGSHTRKSRAPEEVSRIKGRGGLILPMLAAREGRRGTGRQRQTGRPPHCPPPKQRSASTLFTSTCPRSRPVSETA